MKIKFKMIYKLYIQVSIHARNPKSKPQSTDNNIFNAGCASSLYPLAPYHYHFISVFLFLGITTALKWAQPYAIRRLGKYTHRALKGLKVRDCRLAPMIIIYFYIIYFFHDYYYIYYLSYDSGS